MVAIAIALLVVGYIEALYFWNKQADEHERMKFYEAYINGQ